MTQESIQEAEDTLALELFSFIQEAIGQILREEDETEFLAWVRAEAPRRLPGLFADLPNEQAARAVAFELGTEIWNKVPLPGAGYRPRPIPRPERNAPCPCGSGLKHKKCCGAVSIGHIELPLQAEDAWALVLAQTSEAEVAQLSGERRVPRALLPGVALRLIEMGGAEIALSLLEPLFDEPGRLEERDVPAIEALIEAYDELGLHESKEQMIARLSTTLRPALRIALWEILAQSFTSQGNAARAWQAAEELRGLDPDNPVLGSLETILLLGENRLAEASERAQDALQRHRRRPGLSDEALELLQQTVDDPTGSRRRLLLDELLPTVERFEKLLAAQADRPVRPYTVQVDDERPEVGSLVIPEDLLSVDKGWVDASLGALDWEEGGEGEEVEWEIGEDDEDEWEEDGDEDDEEDEDSIDAEGLAAEQAEADEWDLDSADDEGGLDWMDDEEDEEAEAIEEMWSVEGAEGWLSFLEETPQAFDSLLVLADLIRNSNALADLRDGSLRERLIRPLVQRGVAILDASLAAAPSKVLLPADLEENVFALEILQAAALATGAPFPDVQPMERILELDPEDHQEVRLPLALTYLAAGEPQKTLDLVDRFRHKELLFLGFAEVLALRRLDRKDEALALLDQLVENVPGIATAIALSSPSAPQALLEMWQNDEELWQELAKRMGEDPVP
jgi:hypothetical protein